ncbi:hypothetical protein FKG94_23080 [Exilibacterium tricleocarpae]|uniref:Tetratricopeptide repeat protein n=1 Tax=Exilibacterium tricleocarpae TaxID=2591008 RepID=A0A545SXI5_9GAMM|nr:hypothetical protein [Exilibacterium tricleocarpae]TQV69680.1 hypothetical protein FKG94_23080 [Exilibacterium tricleocarpae]
MTGDNQMVKRVPESILRDIDSALAIDDIVQKEKIFDALVERLSSLEESGTRGEAAFLIGYIYYLHPKKKVSSEIESGIRQNLMLALNATKDPSVEARSKLYLGHQSYDKGDYKPAAKWFRSLKLEYLPDYLRLKALEMRLCCSIRNENLASSLDEFDMFVAQVKTFPVEDLWPQELARTLREKPCKLNLFEAHRFQKSVEKLDDAGQFGRWFSEIAEEVENRGH